MTKYEYDIVEFLIVLFVVIFGIVIVQAIYG